MTGRDYTTCKNADCQNQNNGQLTKKSFGVYGYSKHGDVELYDKVCYHCRRRRGTELKAKNKERLKAKRNAPKPVLLVDWSEFDGQPWAVRLANDVIKGAL